MKNKIDMRLGEINRNVNNEKMTIIMYRNCRDIDICFEDGSILKHKNYHSFKTGKIHNPNHRTSKKPILNVRIGETSTSIDGEPIKIIDYRKYNDIDIQFEDGTIERNKSYYDFSHHKIRKNNANKNVGLTAQSRSGESMTVIAYRQFSDIDVQFADGTIVHHKSLGNFKKGLIENPNAKITMHHNLLRLKTIRIGETMTSSMGETMTIIDYRNTTDIDVKFEDGTIVEHKKYCNFKKGNVENPNNPNSRCNYLQDIKKIRVGETAYSSKGQKMTIIRYHSYADLDVQFEDGTIVTNRDYNNFKLGCIRNPNYKKRIHLMK